MAALTWAVLAVSFFNTICLLWLGLMVLLVGNRRSAGVWLTGVGMLLGALFFTSHTAIFGRGLADVSYGMNFWWWLSWTPAVAAPLAWYSAMLWYGGFRFWPPALPGEQGRERLGFAAAAGMGAVIVLLLIFANPLPTYAEVAERALARAPGVMGVPYLVLAYLLYSLLCYLLPLDLLRRAPLAAMPPRALRAHRRARPWLSAASLSLLAAGGVLSWAALWALTTRPLPSLADPAAQMVVMRFDLAVQVLVALAVTLLGRAVVGFEVFTGRAMPRGRFFRHWRSTLLLAGGFGAAAALSLAAGLRPIYGQMLAAAFMVIFSALFAWRTFAEREDFMARLRPFIASQDLYGRLTAPAEREAPDHMAQFGSLCAGVLEVRAGVLVPTGALAALAGPGLVYPPSAAPPDPETLAALAAALDAAQRSAPDTVWTAAQQHLPHDYEWAVPLWSAGEGRRAPGRRLCGILLLAEKTSRAPLTEEALQVAQAAGERLVDSLAAAEMARLALDLLGQRLAQARVLEGQGRRILHDEVLPDLHAAILDLSQQDETAPGRPAQNARALAQLSAVHRRISDLMRALPLATPHRLAAGGLSEALPALLEGPLAGAFTHVHWQIEPEAAERARDLPLFSAEVLFFAARELLRNAARHARGSQPNRPLSVWIGLRLQGGAIALSVADDGVGMGYLAPGGGGRSGGAGLRIHSALLAAVGASLELAPSAAGGLTAVILYSA